MTVANDKWVPLPDMAKERDECKVIFHAGRVHVIGGYCTEMQGRFEKSAEVFDVHNWKWNDVEENLLSVAATCPRTCVSGNDELYIVYSGNVLAFKDATWQCRKTPCRCMQRWQGKLMVFGSKALSLPYETYMLDLEKYTWTKVETPKQYSGHV